MKKEELRIGLNDKITAFLSWPGTMKELLGIKYIHQLQNLHFFLTNEELSVI